VVSVVGGVAWATANGKNRIEICGQHQDSSGGWRISNINPQNGVTAAKHCSATSTLVTLDSGDAAQWQARVSPSLTT